MRRLSEHDASAMLAFVSELKDFDDVLPFPPRLLARLQELIACDSVGYSELDPVHERSILQVRHSPAGEEWIRWGDDVSWPTKLWWCVHHTHPLCGYRSASGDSTTARKVSDFASLRDFRRTPIYDAFFRGWVDHWLDVGLTATMARTRTFIFTRHRRPDFDERDRLVANLVQPHLAARADAAEAALQATSALAAIEDGEGEEPRRVVLCSHDGVIEFASPSSRALLERYLGIDNGRVAAGALKRPKSLLTQGERGLSVRVARTGALYVLLLEERDSRIERLTARERQILEYVALGQENDAIGFELGIAPATVAKHLERVFRKLGVANRTAAAALLNAAGGQAFTYPRTPATGSD